MEHMLLGEAIGLSLHANQEMIMEGFGVLSQNKALLIGRQATSMLAGLAVGGTGGPSLSFVAGMGDVYHNIELVASEFKIFVTTVDVNQPILPQLPANVQLTVAGRLEGIGNTLLLGK
ncbi:hypothetical protein HFP89_06080 [Wenzhouxiangella sp. XN79A]|uniref:hypothetical protein n=1 Tax=Wenzhouxiangella sp. XN79A TaxID=2724193 RepID=UPI00144AF4D3|nr:hypothetical protein [Wenzhouxiangella sp. XN79A]NKI34729.1 hypothetical protein [Wenzhouxiangella sp. XN79A]